MSVKLRAVLFSNRLYLRLCRATMTPLSEALDDLSINPDLPILTCRTANYFNHLYHLLVYIVGAARRRLRWYSLHLLAGRIQSGRFWRS